MSWSTRRLPQNYDKYANDLVREMKKTRPRNLHVKTCPGKDCPSLGIELPAEMFYKNKVTEKLSTYCVDCKRAQAQQYKLNKLAAEDENKEATEEQLVKYALRNTKKIKFASIKAKKICQIHKGARLVECGCTLDPRSYKSKKHRAKIAISMQGNKNALGNSGRKGRTLSDEHKYKVRMALQEWWKRKKKGASS